MHNIHNSMTGVDNAEKELLKDAKHKLSELRIIAQFLNLNCHHHSGSKRQSRSNSQTTSKPKAKKAKASNIQAKPTPLAEDEPDSTVLSEFDSVMDEIQNFVSLFASTSDKPPVAETITIATPLHTLTTTKATLRQAPEGTPLYNMASDEWGHDKDSDGNIYQDVNSELFVSIINHLRLKELLKDTSIAVPPIVVYDEQKTALENLLSYYTLGDVPVKTLLAK